MTLIYSRFERKGASQFETLPEQEHHFRLLNQCWWPNILKHYFLHLVFSAAKFHLEKNRQTFFFFRALKIHIIV